MLSPIINSFLSGKRLTMLSSRSCISLDDCLHCLQQIFGHEFRLNLPRTSLIFPLAASITAQHKRGVQTRVARELNVAVTVADHPASCEIDLKISGRAIDQPCPGLAAVAV